MHDNKKPGEPVEEERRVLKGGKNMFLGLDKETWAMIFGLAAVIINVIHSLGKR